MQKHELHMSAMLIDSQFAESFENCSKCSCQLALIHLFYLVACLAKIDDHQCDINMLQRWLPYEAYHH